MGVDYYAKSIVGINIMDVIDIKKETIEIPQYCQRTGKQLESRKTQVEKIVLKGQEFDEKWDIYQKLEEIGLSHCDRYSSYEIENCFIGVIPGSDDDEYKELSMDDLTKAFEEARVKLKELFNRDFDVKLHIMLYCDA